MFGHLQECIGVACRRSLHEDLHASATCKSCRLASHRLGVARRRLGIATHHSSELTASLCGSCGSFVKIAECCKLRQQKSVCSPSMSDSCTALAQMRACMCAPQCCVGGRQVLKNWRATWHLGGSKKWDRPVAPKNRQFFWKGRNVLSLVLVARFWYPLVVSVLCPRF